MAFPQTALPVSVELQINGAWTDVSADTRGVGGTDAIRITRGATSSGGGQADRGTSGLTFDNNTGKYSSRNPRSPYFGFIGRNTPLRVGVAYGSPWFDVPHGVQNSATTPDAAVLDVTGDLDVRFDVELAVWGDGSDVNLGTVELGGKYNSATNQRSWRLTVTSEGRLELIWSTDGAATLFARSQSLTIPPYTRMAVRAVLDVNNGSGGYTVTFYTSFTPGTSGPWTQLGDPLSAAGVTSIFNSSSPVTIGEIPNLGFGDRARKIFKAEIRDGIGGTIVANPNFEAQPVGTTSFADTAPSPRTWTVPAGSITNVYRRLVHEVTSWPPQWDTGGKDVTTPITGAGILQRLGQGAAPIQSTLRRRIPTFVTVMGYWPMEEGADATQAASPIKGVRPMQALGLGWASDSSLAGSAALPAVQSPCSIYAVPKAAAGTTWRVECVFKIPTAPTGGTTPLFLNVDTRGTVARWRISLDASNVVVKATDASGATLATLTQPSITSLGTPFGQWCRLELDVTQSGGNIAYGVGVTIVGGLTPWHYTGSFAGTAGSVANINSTFALSMVGTVFGHIAVLDTNTSAVFDNADTGFDGETAAARMGRLAGEQNLPLSVAAVAVDTELVGPQGQASLLTLLTAAAQADEGILHEAREFLGLRYRGRASMYLQRSAIDLPYTASPQPLLAPLSPVEDDQGTRNDSTVTRAGGSFGRSVIDEGPLSILPPPLGVGVYDEAVTLNLHDDTQPEMHAGWRTHLGTWDEARFPQVTIELAKNPALIPAVCRIETGSRIRITGTLPTWLPSDPIDLMVLGYTESIGQFSWRFTFTCVPYGPWNVAVTDDAVLGRVDTDGSQLLTAATSTATSLSVVATDGPPWTTDPAEAPWDIRVGGETMTVTAVTGAVEDSFTRTTASGWGSATTGQAWTRAGGAAADFSTNGTTGRMSLTSVNVTRWCTAGALIADYDVVGSVSSSALATGGSHFLYLIGRFASTTDYMVARLEFTTSAAVILSIRKRVAGVETQLSTFTSLLTHSASTLFRWRFQAVGTTFRAKVWLASAVEPDRWDTIVVDASVTAAGTVGVASALSVTNTNALPVTVVFDDFALLNPQTFTVTRSVNGVVKAQSAGADLRLANPAIVAL